jgi:hypothetical protein
MTLYADYVQFVTQSYQYKKNDGSLAARLREPTPANVRAECVDVCTARFERGDEETLKNFFGFCATREDYIQKIRKFDIDKFRQLVKLMKNGSIDTDQKNIELLAWLLNLTPRPYNPQENYSLPEAEISPAAQVEENKDVETKGEIIIAEEPPLPEPVSNTRSRRRTILTLSIMVTISILSVTFLTSRDQCMYWTGDHYQPISCEQKFSDTLVIAYDAEKIRHFKKITDWRSINGGSIGKLWYVKIDGKIEFYTADGFHPTEIQYRLRPVTSYIINKYVTDK